MNLMTEEADKSKEIKVLLFVILISIILAVLISVINIMDRDLYAIFTKYNNQYSYASIYRIIPNALILTLTNFFLLDGNLALIIVNSIFLSLTAIVLYKFLRLFFSIEYSIVGIFIFFTCLPVLFYVFFIAFYDSMIYFTIILGFYGLKTKNEKLFIVATILGAFIKETILILPFCYLFTHNEREIKFRLPITIILAGSYILERIIIGFIFSTQGTGLLDFFNLMLSLLVVNAWSIALVPLAFNGYFFIVAIIQYFNKNKQENEEFLSKNLLPALLFIFLTTFLLGRFNELRLVFIGFPIIIPLAMYYMQEHLQIFKSE